MVFYFEGCELNLFNDIIVCFDGVIYFIDLIYGCMFGFGVECDI